MSYCNQTKWRWFQFCMLAQATGNQLHCQNLKHWELKSPIGLLWNQTLSFAIYKRTSKALFLSRCKVSFIFWAPQTFPSPLFPCILQTVLPFPGLNICQDGPSAIQNYSSKMLPNRSCSFSTNPSVFGSGEWVINLTVSYQPLELLSPKESKLLWNSWFLIYCSFHPCLSQKSTFQSLSYSYWRFWF